MKLDALTAISPIDGRYRHVLESLDEYFSEYALIKNRVLIEIKYLDSLSKWGVLRKFTVQEKKVLMGLVDDFKLADARRVKQIESKTNHDVKSVEYWIKEKLAKTTLKDVLEFVHFGLTSEDVNNLAYHCMISGALEKEYLPTVHKVLSALKKMIELYKTVPMMSRTHGQPASPTTMGKELAVFYHRIQTQIKLLPKLTGKLNGAVGNYNAHHLAFPKINWFKFSREFIKELGLEPNLVTTQIEPHDSMAELFQVMVRVNNVLLDLNRDIWGYISWGYFKQLQVAGEVGSSTMPHKVNPINFESSEGNLGIANALLNHMANKLPISRFQRDLSDSTVFRNVGVAVSHSIFAFQSSLRGLKKLELNKEEVARDLDSHPELLAEGIQMVLRREGADLPYEALKKLTRGKKVTLEKLHTFIDELKVSSQVKQELKSLTPAKYIGLATKIVKLI
jgi:adenylosuccinate lyase